MRAEYRDFLKKLGEKLEVIWAENVKQRSVRPEDVKREEVEQENIKPGDWGWNPQVYTHDVWWWGVVVGYWVAGETPRRRVMDHCGGVGLGVWLGVWGCIAGETPTPPVMDHCGGREYNG